MKKLWSFFENMDEFVYATDMDTNELVYMNKKIRQLYGITRKEEYLGKHCYALLQGCSEPCANCNNCALEEGEFKEWEYYNPSIERHLILRDTMYMENGKRYRIELAMDADAKNRQAILLRNYQNLEAIANEGLRIALRAAMPDQSIDVILEYLGKALNGERTYIFEMNAQMGWDDNTYEWVADGVTPQKDNLQHVSAEICANWYRNFKEGKNIEIDDLENIREDDPLQYENLKRQGIRSLVVVPLYDDGKVIGFYGVDNPPVRLIQFASNMLQIVGCFIVSSIKRRNLVRKLEKLSYSDQLTNLGNRHAMVDYTTKLPKEKALGTVYCDITGLKRVNDSEGHEAGDRLIVRACDSLRQVFQGYGLFRIGGDELLVLCSDITEAEMQKKVQELRLTAEKNQVVLAVGMMWQPKVEEDIDGMLKISEKRMYEDKAKYYASKGIDRRK